MVEPLKLGLAGLGTVGSAVVRMLHRSHAELATRAGRPLELVAYASKDPPKDNTIDLSNIRKVADPVALARDPGIDILVELMGGQLTVSSAVRSPYSRRLNNASKVAASGSAGVSGSDAWPFQQAPTM